MINNDVEASMNEDSVMSFDEETLEFLMRLIEDNEKEDITEYLKVNMGVNSNSVIFYREKTKLNPEGKVEFKLEHWINAYYYREDSKEYRISFPITYIQNGESVGYDQYTREYSKAELENDITTNEIIDRAMELLKKDTLVIEDFSDIKGYGEIVHCIDERGKKYSKLANIELYNKHNKRSIEKLYNELDETDEEKIIQQLGINLDTPMGEIKREIVNNFCNKHIWEEYFMYRGYCFSSLDADVWLDYSKVDDMDDVIEKLEIRPNYIECPGDYYIMKFYPKERFHIKSWVDYLKLLISFVEHLETINIDGVDINFTEFWYGTPEFVEIDKDTKVLEDIKFTKEEFGFNGTPLY